MNEFETVISVVAGLLSFISMILGWFARELWGAVKELKTDLAKLREEIPKEYLPKDAFEDFRSEWRSGMQRILDKLDNKVDK